MLLRRVSSSLLLAIAGCGGARVSGDASPGLLDVWSGFEVAHAALASREDLPCERVWGTWFEEFGVRGAACVAAQAVPPEGLIARAGPAPFRSGPHVATAEAFDLDLTNVRDFGRYNPAFVRWIAENAVAGAGRPEVRLLTQPVYDRHGRRLARLYWLAHEDMAADGFPASAPAGVLSDYAAFLEGGPVPEGAADPEGGFSVFVFTSRSEGLLPRLGLPLGNEWEARYEANTAYGFWLRRRADGTVGLWHDGLRRLLAVYDADWLAGQA